MPGALPAGYVRLAVGSAVVVCAEHVVEAVRIALRDSTLHEWAARHPAARPLAGRGISYAVPLSGDIERVVVRHNRHGGMLAPITGDLFRAPTRAPLELRLSERLRELGVPTPRVLGYAIYPSSRGLCRVDVMTAEVADSEDLSAALTSSDSSVREQSLRATAALLGQLGRAGARHHDLNIKNVLLEHARAAAPTAHVLDVDRVTFMQPGRLVTEANLARLLRSARKWQAMHGASVTDAELAAFAAAVRDQRTAVTLS